MSKFKVAVLSAILALGAVRTLAADVPQTVRGLKMLTTINLRGPHAPYRLLRVHPQGYDTVDRCAGGDAKHSRHCSLHVPGPRANLRRGHIELADVELKDATQPIGKLSGRWFEVSAEIDPQSATRCGARILSADRSQPPLELAFKGNTLCCGELVNPMVRIDPSTPLRLHVHVLNGQAQIRAQGRLFFEIPFRTDPPCRAELFSAGGSAKFIKVDAWQLAHDDAKTLAALVFHRGYQRQKRRAAAYQQAIDRLKEKQP